MEILRKLLDIRIYLLVIPATIALYFIDPALAITWAQWGLVMFVVAGLTLIMRKVMFNTFDMSEAINKACESSSGAATCVLAVAIVMAAMFMSVTQWLSL